MSKFIITAVVFSFLVMSCSIKSNTDTVSTTGCTFSSSGLTKTTAYSFDPNTFDVCEQFDGATTRWTGMAGVSHTTIALPTVSFKSGEACGQCYSITGPSGTIVARVADICPSCPSDTIDMDVAGFNSITNGGGTGIYNVTITPISCGSSSDIRVFMNSASNPFYFNMSFANHNTPIQKAEVSINSGAYQNLSRVSNTGAYEITNGGSVTGTQQVRLTDIFDQTVTMSFDSTSGAATNSTSQFGNCP